jgi:hypothetical protein
MEESGKSDLRAATIASFFDEATPHLIRVPTSGSGFRSNDRLIHHFGADLVSIGSRDRIHQVVVDGRNLLINVAHTQFQFCGLPFSPNGAAIFVVSSFFSRLEVRLILRSLGITLSVHSSHFCRFQREPSFVFRLDPDANKFARRMHSAHCSIMSSRCRSEDVKRGMREEYSRALNLTSITLCFAAGTVVDDAIQRSK